MNTKKKTIIAKNMASTTGNALFLFETDNYFEYVVATLNKEDEQKQIGETVRDWEWGHYFMQDILAATDYLINKDSKKDFTIIKFKIDTGDFEERYIENRIKIFAKLDNEDITRIENKISNFLFEEEEHDYEDMYKTVLGDLGYKWEYISYDYEIEID